MPTNCLMKHPMQFQLSFRRLPGLNALSKLHHKICKAMLKIRFNSIHLFVTPPVRIATSESFLMLDSHSFINSILHWLLEQKCGLKIIFMCRDHGHSLGDINTQLTKNTRSNIALFWQSSDFRFVTKKTWPYRSVVEKIIRRKDAYLPCARNVFCFWEKRKVITPWASRCTRSTMMAVCCQHSKGLETMKKLSRVGELSLAGVLQGSKGYPGTRVTVALR